MKPVLIEGMLVDLAALRSISHRFDPDRCGKSGCCCNRYEVGLEDGEMQRMLDWQPLAARFQPALLQSEWDFPFDQDDEGRWVIETGEDASCPFAYQDLEGRTFCSVHSAALEQGKDPYRIKPRSCTLWPLAIADGEPPLLTLMEGVLDFPCNRRKSSSGLSPGIAELLDKVFGATFLERVQEHLRTLS